MILALKRKYRFRNSGIILIPELRSCFRVIGRKKIGEDEASPSDF